MIEPARRAARTAMFRIGCMKEKGSEQFSGYKLRVSVGAFLSEKLLLPLFRAAYSSRMPPIRIVLCRPSHPGNIGAAARAMKAMGLADLRLVQPEHFPAPEAQWMATNAGDVLEAARVHATLREAIAESEAAFALSG